MKIFKKKILKNVTPFIRNIHNNQKTKWVKYPTLFFAGITTAFIFSSKMEENSIPIFPSSPLFSSLVLCDESSPSTEPLNSYQRFSKEYDDLFGDTEFVTKMEFIKVFLSKKKKKKVK